ncbi:MAG: O-antigen ligase family protein, partial [Nitrospiraceae bacterium]
MFSYALLLYVLVSFPLTWDDIVKLLKVLILVGAVEGCLAIFQGVWLKALRPSGTFFNPNFLAGYLVAMWSMLLGYLCFATKVNAWSTWRMTFSSYIHFPALILIMPLFLVAILLTGSRGGLLALFVGTAVIIFLRFGVKGLSVSVAFTALTLLTPNPLHERIRAQHNENPLGYARVHIWQSAVNEIID